MLASFKTKQKIMNKNMFELILMLCLFVSGIKETMINVYCHL